MMTGPQHVINGLQICHRILPSGDLFAYPMLAWRWYIEVPIRSPLDERTREGDDHPAQLFLRFETDRGEKRAMVRHSTSP